MKNKIEVISGIYKIESTIKPERIYIGSSFHIDRRWKSHLWELKNNKHHSKILQNHFNKYGIEDLKFSIIEEYEKDRLTEREQYYLDTLNPYFNGTKFAINIQGSIKDEECRNKIRQKIIGLKRSEETKIKLKNFFSIPVLQYDKSGNFIREFSSGKEAGKFFKISYGHIGECCNGNIKTAGGYIWRHKLNDFIQYKIDIPLPLKPLSKEELIEYKTKHLNKITLQYSINGEFLNEFSSKKEASIKTGICSVSISRVCNNKRKTAGGFVWKYKL